jgi:type II secretory pathway pseudopilin PulG
VELLVVISIIAVLIGLLLPALSEAKEIAYRAKCLSGTRQVMIATRAYQNDNKGWFPREGPTWNAPTFGVHQTLVAGDYIYASIFTSKGCPYGPADYNPSLGNYYYSTTPGTVSIGINMLLQSGNAYVGTPTATYYSPSPTYYPSYGQFNDSWARLRKAADRIFVASCSVSPQAGLNTTLAYPGAGLQNTLGITSFYFGGAKIPGRHRGEGLPMTFYDGHGRFVPTKEIYPYTYDSIYPDYTMMEWSIRSMYYGSMDN